VREASREYCRRKARRLIERHWPQVEAVAQALLECTTLAGYEIRRVTEGVEGAATR
jgi:hypothetical protein